MTEILTALTALATMIAAFGAAWIKLSALARPLAKRRRFPIAILGGSDSSAAVRFVARLKEAGFQNVHLTRSAPATLGYTVVLWQPGDLAPSLLESVQNVDPEGYCLAYSHARLPIRLSEKVLASNSLVRLQGDLASLAEASNGETR